MLLFFNIHIRLNIGTPFLILYSVYFYKIQDFFISKYKKIQIKRLSNFFSQSNENIKSSSIYWNNRRSKCFLDSFKKE